MLRIIPRCFYSVVNLLILLVSTLLVWTAVCFHYTYRGVLVLSYVSEDLYLYMEKRRGNWIKPKARSTT